MVPWIVGGLQFMALVHGSPNIVGVPIAVVSYHQHDYSGGPNDPGVFGSWLLPC